ncbi:MAG TPA: tRNA lysidine(34) synthetase TilS [Verrucomicrobiae bacterium]|nr:tRNA lysidine(34) synthetase TilS [Verrucomicrobiae bacterium]
MEFDLQPGKYVVAVSGGVDSVTLLDLLTQLPGLYLVVAHYEHGIRNDSLEDLYLVRELAHGYGLPFVYRRGYLGHNASEAVARQARYEFLHHALRASGSRAIITAHHQDDLLETTVLNLLRGTGRRGLSSLKSTDVIKRPLLHLTKDELTRYAEQEKLRWREDSTNADERYLRNYIRHRIMPRFASSDKEALLALIEQTADLNKRIEQQAANYLHVQPASGTLDRYSFIMLPHAVAREIIAEWLLSNTGAELSRKLIERLVVAAKTNRSGSRIDINAGYLLEIGRSRLALKHRER